MRVMSVDEILEEVFERVSSARIFKNREVLMPDYVPDHLPHREEEIKRLASILAPILRGERPNNVFIYGLTGTGKTAVTKLVLKKLYEIGRKKHVKLDISFINTRKNDTAYRILATILRTLGFRVPLTGLSTAELYDRLLRVLNKKKVIMIIVLDEIDHHVKKHGDDLMYKLVRINEELNESKVSIIGITNDVKFAEMLDPRVKSSLAEEEMVFSPYTAEELRDILELRAKEAFVPGALDEGVIPLCAALAAREHGDARKALDLLRISGEIAEREGASKVTVKHVEKAWKQIERDRVVEVVKTLPLHVKLVLASIVTSNSDVTYTGEVYARYAEYAKMLGIETLTLRRVSDILNELDMLGLISVKVVSRGRRGLTKEIRLASSKKALIEGLLSDERIQEIFSSR